MKALVCRTYGPVENMNVEEVPAPVPGRGEVLLTVKLAGISFPEALTVQGKYQVKPPLPFIPGSEIAGIVKALGEGVTGLKVGERVFGRSAGGGFAEEAVASEKALWRIPGKLGFEAGMGMLNYATSLLALRERAELKPGETLLVLGASGGVGITAVELGKLMGARVIACASSAEKLETCRRYGADELVNYEQEDLRAAIKRLTGDKGVDVVYDAVGDRFAEPAVRGMAWNGRYLVIGFAAGEVPKIPLNLPLLKGCSIVGVYAGGAMQRDPTLSRRLGDELLEWIAAGKLKPLVTSRYPLERAVDGFRDLIERRVQGKVAIEF
jgi:NADPH2:quinone reductase